MVRRRLGRTGLHVSPIGYGAFKIGRTEGAKYPRAFDLPNDTAAEELLNGILDLGVTYIDTAPAYGVSEERIGRFISHRRHEFTLSTKVGETFADGRSTYEFSEAAVRRSVERSLKRLATDVIDLVFIHSSGEDRRILEETDAVATLQSLKQAGLIRAIGLSGKTLEGARLSLEWADALMVEYHPRDRSHEPILAEAARHDVGIVVKKGLASGHLDTVPAIQFILGEARVSSLVIGGLDLEHVRQNILAAETLETR